MMRLARWKIAMLAGVAGLSCARAAVAQDSGEKLNVLILGDSLALCGFGERLDQHFRQHPDVNATFTYMACGTNPLSWLKQKPYTTVKSLCGFWSIESVPDSAEPRHLQDTYGMKRNQAPKAHEVPKLEDLLATVRPHILIIQTGSNLFGLFPDTKTVRPAHHAPALKKYLAPFREIAMSASSTLRKIYWVNPPVSGRVGKEVQDFVFEQTRAQLGDVGTVIDSRTLVAYPYRQMDPDKEHFLGDEMLQWADKVFDIVERDLAAQPIASLRPLADTHGHRVAQAQPVANWETAARAEAVMPIENPRRAEAVSPPELAVRAEAVASTEHPARAEAVTRHVPAPPAEAPTRPKPLQVRARLVFKSRPIPVPELLPYQESLVAYVYEIEKVLRGHYEDDKILVMHPAHIALKEQKLDKYRIGKRYKLRLDRVEGTLWDTAKAKDETGQINLQPYLRAEDISRHPQSRRR